MISVFTPSHNTKYLEDAYKSLLNQSYKDWEWIVLLNNGATWDSTSDPRVHVYSNHEANKGVGFYKQVAVSYCKGEILVELDHDDVLRHDALELVQKAFDANPDIGFVYSDTLQINDDFSPNDPNYSEVFGWSKYGYEGGVVYDSFSPHPHNVNLIWYAPNHIRSFKRSTYDEVGGYNPELGVLDDQDIMSRMYRVTDFFKIRQPLYYQRVHAGNTQKDPTINTFIQQETQNMYLHNIEASALAWAKRNDLLALDLGAAHNKTAGYKAVDLNETPDVDYVGDFMTLPFENDSVGVIRAYDFMEHIADCQGLMERFYDLLADGGMLISMTPSTDGRGAFQDPTHVGFWNQNSFWYYTQEETAKYIGTHARFQVGRIRTIFPSPWHEEHNIPYVQAILIAVKNEKRLYGGPLLI